MTPEQEQRGMIRKWEEFHYSNKCVRRPFFSGLLIGFCTGMTLMILVMEVAK